MALTAPWTRLAAAALLLLACPAGARPWRNYGGDPCHRALVHRRAQAPEEIRWSAPVDLAPQYSGDDLLIHYGSPLLTARNTVVFPVKTGAAGGFRLEARRGATGDLLWSLDTDYLLPGHGWVPSCGGCLAPRLGAVVPASGGTVLVRSNPDGKKGRVRRIAFYGTAAYEAAPAAFDATVRICTPITTDARGNLFFGFQADGGAPLSLVSGIARISRSGEGTWRSAVAASGDPLIHKVLFNGAPALSGDGRVLYFAVTDDAVSGSGGGCLVAVDARTLATLNSVRLKDVQTGADAILPDDGTASPTVGPDGDVYFGVLSYGNRFRGWLLHFDATLAEAKIAGGFGWDDTASIVPSRAVPSYEGPSDYLVLTKYNDYVEAGGNGVNRLAVLDPGVAAPDFVTGASVMKEVLVIAGPTPDQEFVDMGYTEAVREWCINTAAVDPAGRCALVNNEDGILYRWDFETNTLDASVVLTDGVGEAYTPTVVGPDGTVYAINNATLFATGRAR
jgi:hypothetical protein